MQHIKLSFNLLKTGLVREHTFTKVPPTEEGCYFIGVDNCNNVDTLELLKFYQHNPKRTRLGFQDHNGEIVYIDEISHFDWLVYVE